MQNAIEEILATRVDQETGEITEEALADLEALELARGDLALELAAYLKGEEAEAFAIADQAKRLRERAGVHERRAARLREWVAKAIEPGSKLEDARSAISWRKSSAVEITDEDAIPDTLCRYTRAPAKDEIAKRLKAGEAVPGAELVARQNLVIR